MIASRSCRVYLAALLIAAGSLVMGTGPAHALTVKQTCTGTEVTSYDPPLTLTRRPVNITVNGLFTTCTDPDASGGSYTAAFTTMASCLELWTSGSGSTTFTWNNPQTESSTFNFNVTASEAGGQVVTTASGIITAGRYAPASAQQVITLATPNIIQCATTGISDVTGPTTLTIYGP